MKAEDVRGERDGYDIQGQMYGHLNVAVAPPIGGITSNFAGLLWTYSLNLVSNAFSVQEWWKVM